MGHEISYAEAKTSNMWVKHSTFIGPTDNLHLNYSVTSELGFVPETWDLTY